MRFLRPVVVLCIVSLAACAAPNVETPVVPAQPSQSPAPPSPSQTETVSSIDVKQYTGIPSPDCKPPATDITGLPKAGISLNVDIERPIGKLNHDLWANFRPGQLFPNAVAEDNQPFWELMRSTRALQCIRYDDYFSDGFSVHSIKDLKKFLQDGTFPVDAWSKRSPAFDYWGCRIYSEDEKGNPRYNFWYLDQVLDVFVAAGLKPEFEVDYMPDALVDGEKVRNYGGGLVNAPSDYNKWHELIYQTAKHCIDRYGIDEVRSWYWSIWNEPDNVTYYMGGVVGGKDSESKPVSVDNIHFLLEMYDFFAAAVKKADAQLKVGGPAIPYFTWLKPFLTHCIGGRNSATNGTGAPLDFISWHVFGTVGGLLTDSKQYLDVIKQFPSLKDSLTLVDEWGQALALWDPQKGQFINNRAAPEIYSNYEAAFLCKFIAGVLAKPENKIDRFFRNGNPSSCVSTYRSLSFSGGGYFRPMPVLNAYILMAKMGDERIELNGSSFGDKIHGFASRTLNGVQVLLYNFDEADRETKGKGEEVDLTVKNVPASWSKMKRYQVDGQNSNAWANLPIFGRPASIEQLAKLEKDSKLKIIEQTDRLENKGGEITFRLSLPANSVCLIVIGDEAAPQPVTTSPHITRVLKEEAMYKAAQMKLKNKDIEGAKAGFEQLWADSFAARIDKSSSNPYCIWGQKALLALLEMEKKSNNASAADKIRLQLLSTTIGDVDRFNLLSERLKYLEAIGSKEEAQKVSKELQAVRKVLDYFANWSKWTPRLGGAPPYDID